MLFTLLPRYYHLITGHVFSLPTACVSTFKVIFFIMCIKTHLYQVRLCYDSPRLFDHFIDIVIPYLFTNIFDTPPQKVRKVFSCPVKVHDFSILKSELWEWNSMSKTLYNENKIWQIQIVALVDTGTVPEVPGPLGEHSKGKTTIYFWPVPCAPFRSLCFSTFSPNLPTPFPKLIRAEMTLADLGMILRWSGDDFGMILVWFWYDFGMILGWF